MTTTTPPTEDSQHAGCLPRSCSAESAPIQRERIPALSLCQRVNRRQSSKWQNEESKSFPNHQHHVQGLEHARSTGGQEKPSCTRKAHLERCHKIFPKGRPRTKFLRALKACLIASRDVWDVDGFRKVPQRILPQHKQNY